MLVLRCWIYDLGCQALNVGIQALYVSMPEINKNSCNRITAEAKFVKVNA